LITVTACSPLAAFQEAIVPSRVPKRNKADVPPIPVLLNTTPLGLPLADVEAAAGIVTDGRDGTARAPEAVSISAEPLPAYRSK